MKHDANGSVPVVRKARSYKRLALKHGANGSAPVARKARSYKGLALVIQVDGVTQHKQSSIATRYIHAHPVHPAITHPGK